jgi:hypothetical protein
MKFDPRRKRCPHDRIEHCPLYVESHNTRLMGCVDDVAEPCVVERGKRKYEKLLANLSVADPRLIAMCRFSEEASKVREQRARNLRLNGIH